MSDERSAEGLEILNQAAWTLHNLLYVGDRAPYRLRRDLPVDLTQDLVGVLHDVILAEKKITPPARAAS
jgi:hypothetical protein